jgi:hypothetical protein
MPDFQVDSAKLYETLTALYHKLSALEQQIIRTLAIAYEPLNRTVILDCLIYLGVKDKDKPLSPIALKTYIDRLLKLNLLNQDRSQGVQCNSLLVDIAVRDAIQKGKFEAIVEVIEAKIPVPSYGKIGSRTFRSESQFVREVRIGIYRQDVDFVANHFEYLYRF